MITNEVLAGLKTIDHADAVTALRAIRDRVGEAPFREAFFDLHGVSLRDGEETLDFEIFDAPDLIAHIGDPPPMLVEGLLPRNSLVLLAGKPKYGKSLAALDLALSVAAGQLVWGAYPVDLPGPVVYLAMEDGGFETVNRLLKHDIRKIDPPESPHRNLKISISNRSLADPEVLLRLRHRLEQIKPVLLIVDTAREALRIRDWNDAAEVTERLRPLRELARDVCAVLLVAHNRKAVADDSGDEIAGSNAFTSSVDGWISAVGKQDMPGGDRRLTLSIQGRGGMRGEAVIQMDTHTLRFRRVEENELAAETKEKTQTRRASKHEQLVQAVAAQPGAKATIKQIAASLGQEHDTTRKQVLNAVEAGALEEAGQETGGLARGAPARLYQVSAPGFELMEERIYPIGSSANPVNHFPATPNGNGTGNLAKVRV